MSAFPPCEVCGEYTPMMHPRWTAGPTSPDVRWLCETHYAERRLRERLQPPLPGLLPGRPRKAKGRR